MTTQEKLTKVTEAIHKACPDLLEVIQNCKVLEKRFKLKRQGEPEIIGTIEHTIFGPNYVFDGEKYDTFGFVCTRISNNKPYPELEDRYFYCLTMQEDEEHTFEILGQPIGSDAVLRAAGDKVAITGTGRILQYDDRRYHDCEGLDFDLTKTLDQQEEPVINLLYNIFYPNE